ncbi:thiazole synthase, partial [Desulfovibrio sp. XJ01]|nr:thiazole synthase [Nitratidesulfovibrio liaohensis]
ARAFGEAVRAGRAAYLSGAGPVAQATADGASASSPLTGFLGE